MITNFEEITRELNAEEKNLLPVLIRGFSRHNINHPIKEPDIRKAINSQLTMFGLNKKLSSARFRKMVNFIRAKSILPLIATNKGYYVAYDYESVSKQIRSLRERADAINVAADGMEKFMKNDKGIFTEEQFTGAADAWYNRDIR